MKISASLLFVFATLVVIAFMGGYWMGTYNSFKVSDAPGEQKTNIGEQATAQKYTTEEISSDIVNGSAASGIELASSASINQDEVVTAEADNFILIDNPSVIDIIEFLATIEASENELAFEKFGPALDALHEAVKNNPDNFQILLNHFADSNDNSQIPYYLTSVLHGAEIDDKELLVDNLILRLSAQGTESGDTRLLHLVSSRGMHLENEQVIASVKNIALYSQSGDNNKTFALDLLMPYQLNENEKNKVVSDLSFSLNQASQNEVSYIVENIIRFSDRTQRVALATNYLDHTNNFETRVAILSTLHNGSILPNDSLKEALFDIAENDSDPLNVHARDTLMYVFEIDNNEYNRLKSGGTD